jgi:anti-anti-sigma factor
MAALHVEIHESAEAIVIRLEGEAGLAAASGLQGPLNAVMARRPRLVVFDLAGLSFAASLFLGTLVAFRRGVVRQGGRVKLAAPTAPLLEALISTRLIDLFEVADSAAAAVADEAPAELAWAEKP